MFFLPPVVALRIVSLSLNLFAVVDKNLTPGGLIFCREKLLSSARKLPEADREPEESAEEAGDGAPHPSRTVG